MAHFFEGVILVLSKLFSRGGDWVFSDPWIAVSMFAMVIGAFAGLFIAIRRRGPKD